MRRIEIDRNGGAEVLHLVERDTPTPEPGELLVEINVAGVNYIDINFRDGLIPVQLPAALGGEASGTVAAIGQGVDDFSIGQHVAWFGLTGSYADYAIVPAGSVVPVPVGVPHDVAAAAMLQGFTAHYLASSTWPIQPGDVALIHAAAGGVGQMLTQIVKLRGGQVIATVSSDHKAEIARRRGADHVINYATDNFTEATLELLNGRRVDVVFDGVGKDTFTGGLQVLRPRGMLVSFGLSSGPVPSVDLMDLNRNGSLFVTCPNPGSYLQQPGELVGRFTELFGWIAAGKLEVEIGGVYPLAEAARAHAALENRRSAGKLLLKP
ncbi:NADPH:quinone reductase [Mycobacterium sp. 1100029.7]|nr:NADPH:quinone reductase [Mycobacterium sp. 1100029.7]